MVAAEFGADQPQPRHRRLERRVLRGEQGDRAAGGASYEGKDGLSPRLATAWEGSADGKSVTFKLREGVTWHDGKPFTSADVAFSALQVWKPLQNLGRVVFKNLDGGRHAGRAHRDLPLLDARRRSSSSATRCRR